MAGHDTAPCIIADFLCLCTFLCRRLPCDACPEIFLGYGDCDQNSLTQWGVKSVQRLRGFPSDEAEWGVKSVQRLRGFPQ